MAGLIEAQRAQDAAWGVVGEAVGVRPSVVKLVGGGDEWSIGIVLGAEPTGTPPREVLGVPASYEVNARPTFGIRSKPRR